MTPRHPQSVFISYAPEDAYFVDLLIEVLAFHRIKPWHDNKRLARPAATKLSELVAAGIQQTDAMIVVLSPAAVQSEWVRKEVFAFTVTRADPLIVPIRLAAYDTAAGIEFLDDAVVVDCTRSMLTAFKLLLEVFGKRFLPIADQRSPQKERRSSGTLERLEYAFQRIVEQQPGLALAEALPAAPQALLQRQMLESLHAELARSYLMFDPNGRPVTLTVSAFEQFILGHPRHFDALELLVPHFFISGVVRRLAAQYTVLPRERRTGPTPAAAGASVSPG